MTNPKVAGIRERILNLTIGTPAKFKREPITIYPDGEPLEVVVRQPTMDERAAILASAGVDSEGKGGDFSKLATTAVITCVYTPDVTDDAGNVVEEGVKVFGPEHAEIFRKGPAGGNNGWIDDLTNAAMALVNVKPETARGN